MIGNYRFLYLFALCFIAHTQLYGPSGHCMANCADCDPYILSRCRGSQPCQDGYYAHNVKSNCILSPSLQLLSQQLGQRQKSSQVPFFSGWGHNVKATKCDYPSLASKQIIDVIGFFQSSHSLEKQYQIPKNSEMLDFSFTLVRNDWIPFSDFLMIEPIIDEKSHQIYEISYQKRKDVNQQPVDVRCQGKRVFIQNFRIKINNSNKGRKLKIIFNSFLFQGVWGISNVKLVAGCVGFTSYDHNQKSCTQCSEGMYYQQLAKEVGKCIDCPQLCQKCQKGVCYSCKWGQLKDGKCLVPSSYKQQKIKLSSLSTCNNISLMMNNPSTSLALPSISNDYNSLYDEIVVNLDVYYDADTIKIEQIQELILYINGQVVSTQPVPRSSHFGECQLFHGGRVARFELVTKPLHVNDNIIRISVEFRGSKRFGISSAHIYSIKKDYNPQQLQQKVQDNTSSQQIPKESTSVTTKNGLNIIQSQTKYKVSSNSSSSPSATQMRFDSDNDAYSQQTSYSTNSKGYLQISIKKVPQIKGMLHLQIRPITPNDYNLVNSYYQDDNIILIINITKSFINGVVTIKQVNVSRLLQRAGQTQVVASVEISRFDSYTSKQLENIEKVSVVFNIIGWITIIGMFLAVLSGFGIVVEEHLITLQIIYLHVYIGFDLLPLSFRETISQLRIVGFLHFIPQKMVITQWSLTPQAMYWLSPQYFNFYHALSPILLTLLIYGVWFLILLALKKWFFPHKISDDSRSTFHKIADNIVCRAINFADSIWRYQFISVLLICTIQIISSQQQKQTASLCVAIIILILTTVWLTVSQIHIRNQYYQNQYSQFIYLFEDRYHSKIPLHSLPSRHHRLGYPIIRIGKLLLFVCLILLVKIPIITLVALISINSFQLWYLLYNSIYSDNRMQKMKILQSSALILIQSLLLIIRLTYNSMTTEFYLLSGYLLCITVILTVFLTLLRSSNIIYLKYVESKGINFQEVQIDQKKLQTQRQV